MPRYDSQIYLSTQQVADILQVTKTTVKNWLRDHKITEPLRHPINSYRLWTLKDVEAIRLQLAEERENK